MGHWDRVRQRREADPETRVVVVEKIETRQLPLVIWNKRLCPFCDSDQIVVTGTKEGGDLRYYKCAGRCRQSFRVREQ